VDSKNADINCTFDDQIVTIRNASTTIRIDNDFYFEISFEKNGKIYPLIDENKTNPSIFLHDSINERISFARKATQINGINDKFGKGEKVKIEALSHDGKIKCYISLSSYNRFPNVILIYKYFRKELLYQGLYP
jgi:hypothetical protein